MTPAEKLAALHAWEAHIKSTRRWPTCSAILGIGTKR